MVIHLVKSAPPPAGELKKPKKLKSLMGDFSFFLKYVHIV